MQEVTTTAVEFPSTETPDVLTQIGARPRAVESDSAALVHDAAGLKSLPVAP